MSAKEKNVENNSEERVFTIVRGGGEKKASAEDAESAWVFESLVGFLTGPIWNSTMMTFLEHKSIVFEPNEDNQDEYRAIHEEYRNLVDLMLNSFTQDLGITAEQFEKACSQANGDMVTSQLQKTLFDQIWAAEDYTVFVHMMIQKNTELQLQALEFLKKRGVSFDATTNVVQASALAAAAALTPDSELDEVLRRSVEEHEKTLSEQQQKEEAEVERMLSASMDDERRRLEAENESERKILEKAIKLSLEEPSADKPAVKSSGEQMEKMRKSMSVDTVMKSAASAKQGISDEDVAKRQTYLRQQRDKLLALKQKKRIQQLDEQPASDPARPRSSKMARSVLQSDDGGGGADNAIEQSAIDPGILAARRALVSRLKAEVVGRK